MIDFKLEANTIYFRLCEVTDAEFICGLRSDTKLNTYISASMSDIGAQKEWIDLYKQREANNQEFYFIICKNDHTPIGTVRLYDFKTDLNSFCWGSWILNHDKTKYAAIESALLVYKAGFEILGFDQSHFDVMKGNEKVHSFHLKMGAQQVFEDDTNIYYNLTKERHEVNQTTFHKFLFK